ncbi:MAG: hypothetical protein RMN25_02280 [Anaerolineae bacterium]|nr:hypothetical protein [Thermoflexales bacterium]MDW8406584.1 hypothetical protein [Anaerolineae bacterium]
MLNENGILAMLDQGLTINWDDGPTLHKITAQARYHTSTSATSQLMRVRAGRPYSDEPLTFKQADESLQAVWTWQEHRGGWCAQLVVTNVSDADVYIDTLEVMRIDSSYGGVFNLGAPPGLWRCMKENLPKDKGIAWEAWAESTASAGGFVRTQSFIVQPTVSNRSRPPAVIIAVNPATAPLPTEIHLECSGERFERLSVRTRADGTLIASGAMLASAEIWIAAGDDAAELLEWAQGNER